MKQTINGQPAEWPANIAAAFERCVASRLKPPDKATSANYFTRRPYKHEYDRGSETWGFVYTLNGNRVCLLVRRGKETPDAL